MSYEYDELEGTITSIFRPEPVVGNEGEEWHERSPLPRLRSEYGLDTRYWRRFEYGSTSALVRRADKDDRELAGVVQAQQVPRELFMGSLRLFGDSILACHAKQERSGPYRFYPGVLMSAWASFEAFVRVYSELLAKTVPNLPVAVRQGLLETVEVLDEGGRIQKLSKRQRLLTRYWWLLKYGYGVEYDKGSRIWQMGREALRKRNALVHYELSDMPSVKATELCGHLEAILLLLIGPSTQAKRSVMPDQYELHGMLDQLRPLTEEYEERPFFKDIPVSLREVIFDCPFENVDATRFPTFRQQTRGSES